MQVRIFASVLFLPLVLISCNAATPSPIAQVVTTPTPILTTTPQLIINLIIPTPWPTNPPLTETLTPTITTAGRGTPSAKSTSAPSLGNTAADAALTAILQNCWHVSDPRQLNGNNSTHRDAFNCARGQFTSLAQSYPTYALVYRMLAWGYYFKDNDIQKSLQAYRTAVDLYHRAGDKTGESEARMRLGLLVISGDRAQACNQFAQAGNLDPANDRASQYYSSYGCASTGSGKSAPPPPVQADLSQVKGKILFKSDREGAESVYVMDFDGQNQKRVTSNLYTVASQKETWSPDGTQVASVRDEGFTKKFGYNNDIWITDPSGGVGRPLANPANDYDPVWSPHGLYDGLNWIAFVSNRGDIKHELVQGEEIWMMHTDSTNSARLTCFGVSTKHPSWSADASQIVFHTNFQHGDKSQIYVISLSGIDSMHDTCQVGSSAKNLSNNSYNDYAPVWVK